MSQPCDACVTSSPTLTSALALSVTQTNTHTHAQTIKTTMKRCVGFNYTIQRFQNIYIKNTGHNILKGKDMSLFLDTLDHAYS